MELLQQTQRCVMAMAPAQVLTTVTAPLATQVHTDRLNTHALDMLPATHLSVWVVAPVQTLIPVNAMMAG